MNVPQFAKNASRRAFLGGALTTAAAAPAVAMAGQAAQIYDPLPAWFEEWKRQRSIFNAEPLDDAPVAIAAYDRMDELERLIASTAPMTAQGAAAQINWVLSDVHGDFPCDLHEQALNVCRDMLAREVA